MHVLPGAVAAMRKYLRRQWFASPLFTWWIDEEAPRGSQHNCYIEGVSGSWFVVSLHSFPFAVSHSRPHTATAGTWSRMKDALRRDKSIRPQKPEVVLPRMAVQFENVMLDDDSGGASIV